MQMAVLYIPMCYRLHVFSDLIEAPISVFIDKTRQGMWNPTLSYICLTLLATGEKWIAFPH